MISREQLDFAADGTAWKTPAMRGYIKKTVLAAETHGENAYKLTFREAADDIQTGDPVDYDFYFDNGTGTSSTSLKLGKELLVHILNANWQQGIAEDFEAARSGEGTW